LAIEYVKANIRSGAYDALRDRFETFLRDVYWPRMKNYKEQNAPIHVHKLHALEFGVPGQYIDRILQQLWDSNLRNSPENRVKVRKPKNI
jgi:hypothetical protein